MKYLSTLILITVFFLGSCKKDKYGNVKQQIKATTSESSNKVKSQQGAQELRYSQFGDFITSITPSSCIGELHVVRFTSDSAGDNNNMVTLVMRQQHLGEEPVQADFSNNGVISVVPVINGVNTIVQNPDGEGWFFKENVTLKLLWVNMGLKQVIDLPTQYTNVELNQFNSSNSQRDGNTLTVGMLPLNQIVSELAQFGAGMHFYFGLSDSTSISYGYIHGNNAPFHYIRSSHYSEWTMSPPDPDQTKTYVSTIGFVNDNIIQIYAGADNIPYTSDDVIVFEPKFWEKIYVNVTEN